MKYLITGGAGFFGSNLSARLIKQGKEVVIFDNLSRTGSDQNLKWLKQFGGFDYEYGDIRNQNDCENIILKHKPDYIIHLAAQVAMTTSIENPRLDFEINTLGTFNIMDTIRKYHLKAAVIYSSTNKVYGDLQNLVLHESAFRYEAKNNPQGIDELQGLDFHSPYGVSKGSAEQLISDYSRIFGIQTVVFRHSTIYGGRQFANVNQGWIGWFVGEFIKQKDDKIVKLTISGNGKQVRDILHVEDAIDAYLLAVENLDGISGDTFNLGGGIINSLSLLELFEILKSKLQIPTYEIIKLSPRKSDQKFFVANCSKYQLRTGWQPKVNLNKGIEDMIEWTNSMI